MSKDQAGSLFNIIDADGLISKSRFFKSNVHLVSYKLKVAIVNDGSRPLSTSRPNLPELEELFPDLSSFAKSDSGMIWLVTILWCHHNLISLKTNRQCTDCNVLSILQAWKV